MEKLNNFVIICDVSEHWIDEKSIFFIQALFCRVHLISVYFQLRKLQILALFNKKTKFGTHMKYKISGNTFTDQRHQNERENSKVDQSLQRNLTKMHLLFAKFVL